MTQFLYTFGAVIYQILTLWLAMIGVLILFGVASCKLRSKRNRQRLDSVGTWVGGASVLTSFALAAAALDTYILSPTLGAGINFFFAG